MTTKYQNIYYSDISAMRKALEKISIELEKANKIEAERLELRGRSEGGGGWENK